MQNMSVNIQRILWGVTILRVEKVCSTRLTGFMDCGLRISGLTAQRTPNRKPPSLTTLGSAFRSDRLRTCPLTLGLINPLNPKPYYVLPVLDPALPCIEPHVPLTRS